MKSINNKLSEILRKMALLYKFNNGKNRFRSIAYENASRTIEKLESDIGTYVADGSLLKLKGIGVGISEKISEYVNTGKILKFEALKKGIPDELIELMNVRGIGPRTIKIISDNFNIQGKSDLVRVLEKNDLKKIKGFGEKKIANILKAINIHDQLKNRIPLWEGYSIGENILNQIKMMAGVINAEVAGSLRRRKESIGDFDILVCADKKNMKSVLNNIISIQDINRILLNGESILSVLITDMNYQMDVRIIKPEEWGAAFLYFTGSKEHNIHLREIAKQKGFKLNEYGLYDKNGLKTAGKTELEIYNKLGYQWVPPELRENQGEIELASKNSIPELVSLNDIKGDLQMHSIASDGNNAIDEILSCVKNNFTNYEYISITDHSKSSRIAGGLSEKEFREQLNEINRLNDKLGEKFILSGIEVDILKNGDLDFADEFLSEFDIVVAAIHSGFGNDNTERIIKACENSCVNVIGHLTGRMIGKREPYPLNLHEIIKTAKKTKTALEINAQPLRMDVNEKIARMALEAGLKLVINTDSHRLSDFKFMRLGVDIARRAGGRADQIINTWGREKLLKFVKDKRKQGQLAL